MRQLTEADLWFWEKKEINSADFCHSMRDFGHARRMPRINCGQCDVCIGTVLVQFTTVSRAVCFGMFLGWCSQVKSSQKKKNPNQNKQKQQQTNKPPKRKKKRRRKKKKASSLIQKPQWWYMKDANSLSLSLLLL